MPRKTPAKQVERDRKNLDTLRPEEIEQGYCVKWQEPQKEPLRGDE